jgi:transposase-like protein
MGFSYPTQFRDDACRRLLAGVRVEVLAVELDVAAATLYRWKHQALVDAGRKAGIKSYEPDELARRRIGELEAELEAVKAASALFNGEQVVRPKDSAQSFEV